MAEPKGIESQPQTKLYDLLKATAFSSEAVYSFCYGYLDSLLESLQDGDVDLVIIRRERFMLDCARLALLGELQAKVGHARRAALRRLEQQLKQQRGTK